MNGSRNSSTLINPKCEWTFSGLIARCEQIPTYRWRYRCCPTTDNHWTGRIRMPGSNPASARRTRWRRPDTASGSQNTQSGSSLWTRRWYWWRSFSVNFPKANNSFQLKNLLEINWCIPLSQRVLILFIYARRSARSPGTWLNWREGN